jgi:hypothetical protein
MVGMFVWSFAAPNYLYGASVLTSPLTTLIEREGGKGIYVAGLPTWFGPWPF